MIQSKLYQQHSVNPLPPYLGRALRFLKSQKGDWKLPCKNGEGNQNKGVVHRTEGGGGGGGKHCFLLVMNAAILVAITNPTQPFLFTMFIFILVSFDIWEFYFFKLNHSLVLLKKELLLKNTCNIVF